MSGNLWGYGHDLKPTEDRGQVVINAIGYAFDRHAANPSLPAEFRDYLTFHIDSNGLATGRHFHSGFRSQNGFSDGH